jgi:large subunit ribosomal protein L6
MSRIGKAPIPLPSGVHAELSGVNHVVVRGPKGELSRTVSPIMKIAVAESVITVERPTEAKPHKEMHGLTRTLIANMVTGVSQGYQKVLELYGVGYRVQVQGARLTLQIGFSHPVLFDLPEGITAAVETFVPTNENQYLSSRITLSGIDKEVLGQTAATLRAKRKPEPYKGKGFRYRGEVVRRKPGKAAQAR